MFIVSSWYGIRQGWHPVASPRPYRDAERLASLFRKVRGDQFTFKVERT
jgi:hypothetical protein